MKIGLLVFLSLALNLTTTGAVVSEKTNGLSVVVASYRMGKHVPEPILDSDELVWSPFYDFGSIELNYPTPTYGIRVSMVDSNGKEVRKTPLGKEWGSKFDKLRTHTDSSLDGITAEGHWDPRGADYGISGPSLPAPNKLFIMDKPGVYTLEIQMQMFKHSADPDLDVWHRNLFRFPPVKIKVEKLSPKQGKP